MIRKITIAAIIFCSPIFAEPPNCYWDLPKILFQPTWVSEAMELHYISQSAWFLVNSTLQDRIKDVRDIVRLKASRMHPNPLNTRPFDKEGAAKIMKEALYEVFLDSFRYHQITNQSDIQDMFYFIESRHHDVIDKCLGVDNFIENREALIEYRPKPNDRKESALQPSQR